MRFHGPDGRIQAQFGIRERGDVDRDLLQEGAFEDAGTGKLFGQGSPQFPVQEFRRERFVGPEPVQGGGGHFLHVVQVQFHFERVIDPVISLFKEIDVIHGRLVFIMRLPHGFAHAMGHQRAGRDNGLHHPPVQHGTDEFPHFGRWSWPLTAS